MIFLLFFQNLCSVGAGCCDRHLAAFGFLKDFEYEAPGDSLAFVFRSDTGMIYRPAVRSGFIAALADLGISIQCERALTFLVKCDLYPVIICAGKCSGRTFFNSLPDLSIRSGAYVYPGPLLFVKNRRRTVDTPLSVSAFIRIPEYGYVFVFV